MLLRHDTSSPDSRRGRGVGYQLVGYLLLIVVPVAVALYVVQRGGLFHDRSGGDGPAPSLLYRLLLVAVVVVAVANLLGMLAVRLRQPRVIGEITAGIVLGPSVLGAVLPDVQRWLLPKEIFPALNVLAQVGVVFFMFLVGREISWSSLRAQRGTAVVVGQATVALPMACGCLLALGLASSYRPDGVSTGLFTAFIGLSIAVTALPVLARILTDRDLLHTPLGVLGMASAGVADVIVWCLLGVVVAAAHGSTLDGTAVTLFGVVLFAVLMFGGARPLLRKLVGVADRAGGDRTVVMGALVCLVLGAAFCTELIGVHAIFGAVVAGLVAPRSSPTMDRFTHQISGLTTWLMLPVFFALVGLQLQMEAFGRPRDLLVCAFIIVLAVASKVGAATLAARFRRMSVRDSLGLGAMMNCRGLTEIIVLQIGLSLGLITVDLFSILLVMTLVTTSMTGPLLGLLGFGSTPGRLGPPVGASSGAAPLKTT